MSFVVGATGHIPIASRRDSPNDLGQVVDDEGEVLDPLAQPWRDKAAALKLLRKLLKEAWFCARFVGSYGGASSEFRTCSATTRARVRTIGPSGARADRTRNLRYRGGARTPAISAVPVRSSPSRRTHRAVRFHRVPTGLGAPATRPFLRGPSRAHKQTAPACRRYRTASCARR